MPNTWTNVGIYVYDNIGLVHRELFSLPRFLCFHLQVGNIVASPQILWMYTQENWFGFVAMSNDDKEVRYVRKGILNHSM